MVLKLSKKVHFLHICAGLSKKPKPAKAIYNMDLKVFITLFKKMIWFIGVWATVQEVLAIKISKKMQIRQKFKKILRLQTPVSSKQ